MFYFAVGTKVSSTGITDGIGYTFLTDTTEHIVEHHLPYPAKLLGACS